MDSQDGQDLERRGGTFLPATPGGGSPITLKIGGWKTPSPLNPVPAKPDTFASFAIFARGIPFFPLSTSVLSVSSVVFSFSPLRSWGEVMGHPDGAEIPYKLWKGKYGVDGWQRLVM